MADEDLKKILADLGLCANVITKFKIERITSDLVPKLSLQEFQELGVCNKRVIMELRIKCSIFNSNVPEKVCEKACAPK